MEAIALGIDQFDCVAPTRMARHGSMLTASVVSTSATPSSPADNGPLDSGCRCATCASYSRGYLRHLLVVGEPTAWRLLSIHNLAFVLGLMTEARASIAEGRFDDLRIQRGGMGGLRTAVTHPGGPGLVSDRRADPDPPPNRS